MSEITREEILRELGSLRAEIVRVPERIGLIGAGKHSDWSAHGKWSSSSAQPRVFELTTSLRETEDARSTLVERLVSDASNERLLSIVKSLNEMTVR